jgi:hypothetical protein
MIEYSGIYFFDGQDVNRNLTKQQVIDMKYVVREHIETTHLTQHNVGGTEFSVSIKAGLLANLYRFQEFLLRLIYLVVFSRLIIG